MKKSNLMPSIVLGSLCLIVALLLSVVNMITGPVIEAAQNAAANAALAEVLPNGKNFEEIEITSDYPSAVTKGYRADGGFVFQMTVTGKSSGMVIMCGVDSNGKVVGTKVITDQETDTYDVNVFPLVEGTDGKYKDMTLDGFESFLVSGATLTSKAYGEAIKAALQASVIAGGGSVDVRTPEQILQDNCNTALGTVDLTFTKWFATEATEGVDAVYVSENNSGYVFVIGEVFVGIDANGNLTTPGANADNAATANTAFGVISASSLEEISELPEGISKNVVKAYRTASGNYVFEVKAYGYKYYTNMEFAGIDDGHFFIKVSISADGKIIDCLTTSHSESQGFGDYCATEEYYDEWRGATSDDINVSVSAPDFHEDQLSDDNTDIGIIASSTFTTYGYQKAMKDAFSAFETFTEEGGIE